MDIINKVRAFNQDLVKYYEISINDLNPISDKTVKLYDSKGNAYFLKETKINALEKYRFLESQGVHNVIYPIKNRKNDYVTRTMSQAFYLNNYYDDYTIVKEAKAQQLFNELNNIHDKTAYSRQLNPSTSRPKFEEITNRLDYKYKMLENYVRSVEARPLDIYSMPILANYQYFLDAKKELVRLQKRIISTIKAKESVDYSFIHNNPKLDHLLNIDGGSFLVSIDNGKIGVESLDLAKYYVENEDLNVDYKSIIKRRYKNSNPFYYDYFRYMVLLIYIARLNISTDEYISAGEFITTSNSIKKYFKNFSDYEDTNEEV